MSEVNITDSELDILQVLPLHIPIGYKSMLDLAFYNWWYTKPSAADC